jgi:hypothetical protein
MLSGLMLSSVYRDHIVKVSFAKHSSNYNIKTSYCYHAVNVISYQSQSDPIKLLTMHCSTEK